MIDCLFVLRTKCEDNTSGDSWIVECMKGSEASRKESIDKNKGIMWEVMNDI